MKKILTAISLAFCVSFAGQVSLLAQKTGATESSLIDAVTLIDAGKFAEAVSILKPMASAEPGNDAVFYYLGLASYAMRDAEEAVAYLQEASRLDTSNFWYKDRLARLYAATSQPELAIAIYEDLLETEPSNYEVYYNLVNLYAQQNKPDEMLRTLDEIESIMGKSDMVTLTKFDVLMRQQKQEEAYEVLKKYNDEYASANILATMGDFNLSNYNDTLALECYNEALSYESDCSQALLGSAEIFRYRGNYPEFFKTVNYFISNEGTPVEPKTRYVSSLIQHADRHWLQTYKSQMDSLVNSMMSAAPSDSTFMQVAGGYYHQTGREDKAREIFKAERDQFPESLSARYNYVQVLYLQNDWDSLLDESEEAFKAFPDQYDFLQLKNIANYNKGDFDGLIKECERLLACAPRDSSVLLYAYTSMGDAYHEKGESSKAYAAYDKALKLNPAYAPVLNNYAYYLCLEGKKLKKAYSMSKITVEQEPDNATYLDTFGWILYKMGKPLEAKPFFKHAMLYGGKDQVALLDHYAEVLYALKDYDTAKVYWNLAKNKNADGAVPDLEERIKQRLEAIK